MTGQTIILSTRANRMRAHALIDAAPEGCVVNIRLPARTIPQNDKMWAVLGELARAKPDGRNLPPHKWKALAMDAAGHKPDWERSLDDQSMVCTGYRSSRLTVPQMSDLIEIVHAYGAQHAVKFD